MTGRPVAHPRWLALTVVLVLLAQPAVSAAGPGQVEGSKSQTIYYKLDPIGELSEGAELTAHGAPFSRLVAFDGAGGVESLLELTAPIETAAGLGEGQIPREGTTTSGVTVISRNDAPDRAFADVVEVG